MQPVSYKLVVGGRPATRTQLNRLETITVTQAMDQAWTADLQVNVTADDRGRWTGESEGFMKPETRFRIEVQVGTGAPIPLIDGPGVGFDGGLSSEPGQSMITLRVQDDSYWLMRADETERIPGANDSAVAGNIYRQHREVIATQDLGEEPARPPPSDRPTGVMPRGTAMETLHMLARRQGMHAYVLPGRDPGRSVGVFKAEDKKPGDFPPLVLLGKDRNIDSFDVSSNAQRPATVIGSFRDPSGLKESERKAEYAQVLSGNEPSVPRPGVVRLRPGAALGVAPETAVEAMARQLSYQFTARGTLRGRCYAGVLQPYKLVTVQGAGGLSANYLIQRVVHTLSRSEYTQAFELVRAGQAKAKDPAAPSEKTA